MSRDHQIAQALGIKVEKVSQLRRRGMPTGTLAAARAWFALHGMRQISPRR